MMRNDSIKTLTLIHYLYRLYTLEIIKPDLNAILDTDVQPMWFKILKIIILIVGGGTLWITAGFKWFTVILLSLLFSGLIIHFFYRIKTKTYTKEWMGWKPKTATGSRFIGKEYYIMIIGGWSIFSIILHYILI